MAGRFIEAAFRSLAIATGLGAGVAGGFTVNQLFTIFRASSAPHNSSLQPIYPLIVSINTDVILLTQISAGLTLGLGALSLFLIISIVIRVCEFHPGKAVKFIFCVDFIIVVISAIGFAVAAVIGFIGTTSWSTDFIAQITTNLLLQGIADVLGQTRAMLAVTAVISLLASIMFVVLKYWLIIFCARNPDLKYNGWV